MHPVLLLHLLATARAPAPQVPDMIDRVVRQDDGRDSVLRDDEGFARVFEDAMPRRSDGTVTLQQTGEGKRAVSDTDVMQGQTAEGDAEVLGRKTRLPLVGAEMPDPDARQPDSAALIPRRRILPDGRSVPPILHGRAASPESFEPQVEDFRQSIASAVTAPPVAPAPDVRAHDERGQPRRSESVEVAGTPAGSPHPFMTFNDSVPLDDTNNAEQALAPHRGSLPERLSSAPRRSFAAADKTEATPLRLTHSGVIEYPQALEMGHPSIPPQFRDSVMLPGSTEPQKSESAPADLHRPLFRWQPEVPPQNGTVMSPRPATLDAAPADVQNPSKESGLLVRSSPPEGETLPVMPVAGTRLVSEMVKDIRSPERTLPEHSGQEGKAAVVLRSPAPTAMSQREGAVLDPSPGPTANRLVDVTLPAQKTQVVPLEGSAPAKDQQYASAPPAFARQRPSNGRLDTATSGSMTMPVNDPKDMAVFGPGEMRTPAQRSMLTNGPEEMATNGPGDISTKAQRDTPTNWPREMPGNGQGDLPPRDHSRDMTFVRSGWGADRMRANPDRATAASGVFTATPKVATETRRLAPADAQDPLSALDPHVLQKADGDGPVRPNGQPHPTLSRADMPHHVARQIADVVQHMPNRPVEITLSPEELGRVRLSVTTSETGIVVNVLAERPETLDLLRRHIDHLGREFQALGYENIGFSFSGGRDGQTNPGKDPSVHLASLVDGDPDHEDAPLADPKRHPGTLPTTGLDLRL